MYTILSTGGFTDIELSDDCVSAIQWIGSSKNGVCYEKESCKFNETVIAELYGKKLVSYIPSIKGINIRLTHAGVLLHTQIKYRAKRVKSKKIGVLINQLQRVNKAKITTKQMKLDSCSIEFELPNKKKFNINLTANEDSTGFTVDSGHQFQIVPLSAYAIRIKLV